MKKLATIISILTIMAILLSACATPTAVPTAEPTVAPTEAATEVATAAPTEEPLGEVLKIGQITSASGAMALYSLQQQRGFQIGLEYASGGKMDSEGRYIIAGRPVEVIVKDDELTAEKGVSGP